MAISAKYSKLLDEYLIDLNAQRAGVDMGYSPKYARQTVYKILQKPAVRAELEKRMAASRISPEELIARLDKMALGELPTKIVTGSHSREEYDAHGAAVSLGKVYALFHDKIDLDISHLNITDEEE